MTAIPALDAVVLDNPVWEALRARHARFAEVNGAAARYRPDMSPFAALADPTDARSWTNLTDLVGPGVEVVLPGLAEAPSGWTVVERIDGVQLVDVALDAADDPEAVVLTPADVPEMLDLVRRTNPGPYLPRTIELGTYLGIRRHGALVAMAGERLHPPGWTEISAVCTDPAYQRLGLATRLVQAVAAGIRRRGETPFLHAAASNRNAIRLYESIGFRPRRQVTFALIRTPEQP